MNTSTARKQVSIESIEYLNNDTLIIVVSDDFSARFLVERNPRCVLQRDPSNVDKRVGLVYSSDDCDLIRAIKTA
jgi:hypothetical protein